MVFINGEKEDVQATDIVPFLLETKLKEHDAIHHKNFHDDFLVSAFRCFWLLQKQYCFAIIYKN